MPRRRRTVKRRRSVRRKAPMRSMVREEMKTNDLGNTALEFSTDGSVANTQVLVNAIPQGTSSIQRVGKKVLMKALQIRGFINAGTTTIMEKVSVLLVYVRSNNQSTTPTVWADILTTQDNRSLTNRDNASKFKILRRWDYMVLGNSGTAGQQTSSSGFPFEEYVVFKKPLVSQWTNASTTGEISHFEKGSLHLCCVGNGVTAGTTKPNFYFRTRLYFCECEGYMF